MPPTTPASMTLGALRAQVAALTEKRRLNDLLQSGSCFLSDVRDAAQAIHALQAADAAQLLYALAGEGEDPEIPGIAMLLMLLADSTPLLALPAIHLLRRRCAVSDPLHPEAAQLNDRCRAASKSSPLGTWSAGWIGHAAASATEDWPDCAVRNGRCLRALRHFGIDEGALPTDGWGPTHVGEYVLDTLTVPGAETGEPVMVLRLWETGEIIAARTHDLDLHGDEEEDEAETSIATAPAEGPSPESA